MLMRHLGFLFRRFRGTEMLLLILVRTKHPFILTAKTSITQLKRTERVKKKIKDSMFNSVMVMAASASNLSGTVK